MVYSFLIDLKSYKDNRGEFYESYRENMLKDFNVVQENTCISNKNVVREFHYQVEPYGQNKLLTVLNGRILDILVNIETKEIYKFYLDSSERKLLFIPKCYAHGYASFENNTIVSYKIDKEYNKESEKGFHPFSFGVNWGIENAIISEKDLKLVKI